MNHTMSFPTTNNNTFVMAPTSPNPYISRKLNNMDQAQVMKREREDWTRLYHKTLKGIEAMIDVQRMIKDMKKIAEETSTTVTEMKGTILMASVNNQTMNTTNITQIAEDLQYLVQSDMDEQAFQVQRMLADELDYYKEKGNDYASKTTSSSTTSFITDKVKNLAKYMKFVKTPAQTRIFRPPPYYQSIKSRGEQDSEFWKEVAMTFVDRKRNTDTSRNGCQIPMYQGGQPHKPYFIAINNKDQVIIGSSKKIVAIHVVGELEVLV